MNSAWDDRLRAMLRGWQTAAGGWGYRAGQSAYSEPTALAGLALQADADCRGDADCLSCYTSAAAWLARLQGTDGSVGLSDAIAAPYWNTALSVLLWSNCRGHDENCSRAVNYIVAQQGNTRAPAGGVPYAHDATIPGWSWVQGTHSWLEPTAWAVLALDRAGHAEHPRVVDGRRLIRDRALRNGGWNYGNSQVFGTDLRPQPGPTGLALLALAGHEDADSPRVVRACEYLARALPWTRAPQSLCWGVLGLSVWGRRPEEADAWLEAAVARAMTRSDCVVQSAYLLLAAAPDALSSLGLEALPWEVES